MTIADLNKYHDYSELFDCVTEQLQSKFVHDTVWGDSGEPAHEKVSRSVEGYVHGYGVVKLIATQHECEAKMQDIEDYIKAIPKKLYREALTMYCLDTEHKYAWSQIAEILGYKGELRRNIANYLKQLTDCEECTNKD